MFIVISNLELNFKKEVAGNKIRFLELVERDELSKLVSIGVRNNRSISSELDFQLFDKMVLC